MTGHDPTARRQARDQETMRDVPSDRIFLLESLGDGLDPT
jgi:hypothetical protein